MTSPTSQYSTCTVGLTTAQDFATHGYALVRDVMGAPQCAALADQATRRHAASHTLSGGTRNMLAQPWCAALAQQLRAHPNISACLPADAQAVQCTYFEKTADRNWLVAPHQDLSVPVAQQVAAPGWQGWSAKEGHWFVQPPATWLAHMVAVRLHLDDCGPSDGPLRVLPGTHTQGRLSPTSMATLRQQGTETVCTAPAGAALLMRPLLVHASSKSTGTSRRRVLHFAFGPATLPHGLRWHTTA